MDRLLCNDCPCSILEPWTGGRQALRCMAAGPWNGRVTGIIPLGLDIDTVAPAWCVWKRRRMDGN